MWWNVVQRNVMWCTYIKLGPVALFLMFFHISFCGMSHSSLSNNWSHPWTIRSTSQPPKKSRNTRGVQPKSSRSVQKHQNSQCQSFEKVTVSGRDHRQHSISWGLGYPKLLDKTYKPRRYRTSKAFEENGRSLVLWLLCKFVSILCSRC